MEVLLELLSGNVEVKISAGKVDTLPLFYMYFLLEDNLPQARHMQGLLLLILGLVMHPCTDSCPEGSL